MKSLVGVSCGALAICALFVGESKANVLYSYDSVFSGTAPGGSSPWVQTLLSDVSPGTVQLTINTAGLSAPEKLTELYLNLNPDFLATSLSFDVLPGGTPGVIAPSPVLGLNAFKADGDGKYDIRLSFAQNHGAFLAGSTLVYQITGIPTLTAADFVFLSMPAGGHGPFDAAIHVQGISAADVTDATCDSGWVSPSVFSPFPVPEPASGFLVAVGLGLFAWLRRQARR
jgi:hypothetical protein